MIPKLVLIVDDDRDFCELLSDMLEAAGYACHTAQSGLDALQWMGEEYAMSQRDRATEPRLPSLILLDWLMTGMDGFGFMSVIIASPKYRRIPVVIISGHELDLEDRHLEWVAHLPKQGLSAEKLLELVARKVGQDAGP